MDDTSATRSGSEVAGVPEAAGTPEASRSGGWGGLLEVAAILGLALWAWILTGRFIDGDLMVAYGVDPGVVPRAIILVIVALALLLLIQELPQPRGRLRLRLHPRLGAVLFAFGVLALYSFTFEALGAFTLMPLFCVALSLAFVRGSFWVLLAYGIGVSVLTWVVFVLALRAPLPGFRLPFL